MPNKVRETLSVLLEPSSTVTPEPSFAKLPSNGAAERSHLPDFPSLEGDTRQSLSRSKNRIHNMWRQTV
jgi:hypothetical protein